MANPTTNYGWPMPTATDLVTDLPADFAAFGQPVDTSLKALNPETTLGDIAYRSATANTNTRLPIGTTGQVLSVVAGVPAWTTGTAGDIEGVTAGVGISGGGTSGTVTVTNDMATTITASGDIVLGTGSGTYDNLPIGTTGQVLTADTTVSPYKVKWASASAAATSYALLNSGGTTMSGNTVTVSGLSGYNKLFVLIHGAEKATTNIAVVFRLNTDSTSKYNTLGPYFTIFTTGGMESQAPNATTSGRLGKSSTATSQVSGYMEIDGCNSSGVKTWKSSSSGDDTGASALMTGGLYTGTSVISSISLIEDFGGAFNGGTIYVYGAN